MREPLNFSGRGVSHLVGGLAPSLLLTSLRAGRWSGRLIALVTVGAMGASFAIAPSAFAQPPPGTGTDLEIDPDAPPPEEPKKEEPALPPADPNAWGVGGKDEEGRFVPGGKKDPKDASKDEDEGSPVDLGHEGSAGIDIVVGFGEMNELLSNGRPSEVAIFSFLFGAQYRAWDIWTMGLRLPYSTGSIKSKSDEHGDYNTFALGNLEVSVSPSFQLSRRLRLPVGIAFTLPVASGDPFANPAVDPGSIAQALVNDGADAARGLEESSLFAYGRFGLVPSVGATYDRGSLHVTAQTKLELMFRTGGAEPDVKIHSSHEYAKIHDPAVNWVTRASASYDFLGGKVAPMLRIWLAVGGEAVTNGERDFSGAQFALEPGVIAKIPVTDTIAIRGGLSFIIPAGGPVGGQFDASINGLRLQAGVLFGGSPPPPANSKPAPPSLLDAPPEEGGPSEPGEAPSPPEGASAPGGSVEQDPKAHR